MPPKNALLEIYEDRIANLEGGVTDCKVDLGILKTKLDDGFTMLSEKLDAVAMLSDRVSALETIEKIKIEIKENDEKAHEKKHARRARALKIGGVIGSGLAALAGLILKMLFGG